MTTLPEALAALDAYGGAEAVAHNPEAYSLIAAVVKAARERVSQDDREARLAEENKRLRQVMRELRDAATNWLNARPPEEWALVLARDKVDIELLRWR